MHTNLQIPESCECITPASGAGVMHSWLTQSDTPRPRAWNIPRATDESGLKSTCLALLLNMATKWYIRKAVRKDRRNIDTIIMMTSLHAPRVKGKSPGLLTVPQHTHRTQSHSHLHGPIKLRKHRIATTPTFQDVSSTCACCDVM